MININDGALKFEFLPGDEVREDKLMKEGVLGVAIFKK